MAGWKVPVIKWAFKLKNHFTNWVNKIQVFAWIHWAKNGYVIYTVYIYTHIFMDPDTSHVSVVPLNALALACSVVMIAEEGSN